MINLIKKLFQLFGIKIVSINFFKHPPDLDKEFYILQEKCKNYTMTSTERLYSVYKAAEYIVANNIEGDIVECGVWKGGSSMMAALALQKFGKTDRKIFLYDTYEGMSPPTEKDKTYYGESAEKEWDKDKKCYSPMDEVRINMKSTGYPMQSIFFIKGKVEDTIPATLPGKIALLRLDTDWYESTYHELAHLYPLLCKNGILIIDDYGFWKGSREATDKYFKEKNITILLNRIDGSGRIAIKTSN